MGSDDDAVPKDTKGSSAGRRSARQASPGVTGHSFAPACLLTDPISAAASQVSLGLDCS